MTRYDERGEPTGEHYEFVAIDMVGEVEVSTRAATDRFETTVTGGPLDGELAEWAATLEQAELQHKEMVKRVLAAVAAIDDIAYNRALTRLEQYIKSLSAEELAFDAFTASSVLAVAFNKTKEEVLADYLRAKSRDLGSERGALP